MEHNTDQHSINLSGLKLLVPQGWQLVSLAMVGPVEADNLTNGHKFQKNVIVSVEPVDEKETLEAYARKQIQKLKEAGVYVRQCGNFQNIKLPDGEEGLMLEHILAAPTGEKVQQIQLLKRMGSICYAITASHLEGLLFENNRQTFLDILLGIGNTAVVTNNASLQEF